ncbi:MAG TPA: DEAD/DEAH box helicase family protein [Holophaga sp.]|nr:DEAD/DEAH box helicase family protein [Holophaga sp.]
MSNTPLSESDICDQRITPALHQAGWDPLNQIRREVSFTAGQVQVRGKVAVRGARRRADYLLYLQPHLPLAVIEAKDGSHEVGSGMSQALAYAEALDIPFVFSSNGGGFLFHDRTASGGPAESHLAMDAFPSPQELWKRYCAWKGLEGPAESVARFPFQDDGSGKEPRYYQRVAVQRTVEAIATGRRRVVLVMATGTGKTYTAFQIIWRLWKGGSVKRVLFLADRNILVDQTRTNDFKPFGSAMTKIQNRMVDTSFEIYLALYQAVSGTEEDKNIYKAFSREFFDLVIVDECHRGSAAENSAWREILDYFQPAIHLGLTATPKETKDISTQAYFGDPIYTYSLKQGIEDGFLAPYKVVRIDLDKDLQGWRPPEGMRDDQGLTIEDRIYNQKDMDSSLVLHERTKRVASKVVDYLLGTDPYGKTIVFCEDQDHASRMRSALVNEVATRMPKEAPNLAKFVVRITSDDDEGKLALDDFIHPEKRFPVIATTFKLLSTGVDARTCKLIVLDQSIQSITEFKQIIGRGTRIHEDTGKLWFTIMDFKKATELFADPTFDGEPTVIYQPCDGETVIPPEDLPEGEEPPPPGGVIPPLPEGSGGRVRYLVSGVPVTILAERVQYYGPEGRLITESLKDYTRKAVKGSFDSLEAFLARWSEAERKDAIVEELRAQGVLIEELEAQVGSGYDPFDLVCHVVFDQPPLTRKERAEQVRKRDVFTKYGPQARAVLDALLEKYADGGITSLEDHQVLRLKPLSDLGTPLELVQIFGGKGAFDHAVKALEEALYSQTG